MINFATSDSVIWNRDQLIIDLAHSMSRGVPRIDIGTKGEGPCALSLGLYDLLDNLCERFNYPPNNVYITTCNLVEHHHLYNIVIRPQVSYLVAAQKFSPISRDKHIVKHFGHFIGHGNWPRLYLGSYLHRYYFDQTVQTYHTSVTAEYHRPFIGLEDLMFNGYTWNEITSAVELLRTAPITIDNIDRYPITNPTTLNITRAYPEFFVEIVNLTYWSGNTFYIDEKIWRPMLMRTPFIVHGPKDFLPRLRDLGFKTFDSWWDEGYSQDPADHQLGEIVQIIDQLASKSLTDLQSMYRDMQTVLDHNYQRMMQIQKHDLYV